jgi:hypothetical protein
MIFKFKVEQKYIDNGIPEESNNCPIALSVNEQLKIDNTRIGSIEEDMMYFTTNDGTEYKALLPNIACEFYTKFDAGDQVEPIEFEVDADVIGPDSYLGD